MRNTQIRYPLALSLAKNIGSKTYKALIDTFGTAQSAFDKLTQSSKNDTKEHFKDLIVNQERLLAQADDLCDYHRKNNIHLIPYEDDRYPESLRHIHNPPPVLYASRSINFNQHRMIAIVGTREPSNYGETFVKQLVASIQPYNPVVISGLAYGIDISAHKAALKQDLPTIGVVAGGLDFIYPKAHLDTVNMINQQGCILSEQPLGIKPERHHFPARNRIIASMASAVVIIEAGQKSGALITAEYANEYNKEVFALPGDIQNPKAVGCHNLIKTHKAHLITSGEDIAYIMGWEEASKPATQQAKKPDLYDKLNHEERSVLKVLKQNSHALNIEEIRKYTTLDLIQVSALLLQLELKQLITVMGDSSYTTAY